jgi:Tol biopolymer transport system component
MTLPPSLHTSSATFRWVSEDAIVLFGMERGRNGIFRLDPRDGSHRRLPEQVTRAAGNLKFFGVGPKGRTLYFVLPGDGEGDERRIVARHAETGDERWIASAPGALRQSLAVSPDGSELAYVGRHPTRSVPELRVVSTSGDGTTRRVYRADDDRSIGPPVAWTPDGSRLLFALESGERTTLASVDAHGDAPPIFVGDRDWGFTGPDLRVHPDGREIAFVAGGSSGEIRILRGF